MTITAERPATINHAVARRAMIDSQLRVSGVTEDFVIAAMGTLPREDFVPPAARSNAYIDRAIPLGAGRALAAPLVQGLMLREAAPQRDDKALLVDCGSGYLAALLRPLVGSLTVLTPAEAVAKRGKGSYSLLVIDGAIAALPAGLAAQLDEGGRVIAGINQRGVTRLAAGRKIAGAVTLLPLVDIGIPVLAEFAETQGWSF
jgi:protein-L-isoaspartate(D-aspartate) O-methyltransferase